ncbi:MAG: 30S ribosomal protein S20 [Candidatus Omnitrophica bacterium]|nr:30S ribosomal protein S20 [Candidatus Omnitrophota bacterium]
MPHRRTSIKTLRKDKKRHQRNLRIKKDIKKAIKELQASILQKNAAEAKRLLSEVSSKLDKAVKKDIIKKNTASRKKSRFNRSLLRIT